MKRIMAMLAAAALLGLVGTGCGGDKDCTELCQEGQAGNCTIIKGDCGKFCAALDNVKSAAGCAGQVDAYIDCLNTGANACDTSCTSQENAMELCLGAYCLANPQNTDCITIVAAIQ